MRPTSIDLRKRVVAARLEDGQSMGQIAERFRIPKGTVQNILERYRDAGTVTPKPQNGGRKPAFSGGALRRLEQHVLHQPDATLRELLERSGLKVSVVCVHHALKKLGFTLKKSLYVRASSADKISPSNARHGAKSSGGSTRTV
jgi:transposase